MAAETSTAHATAITGGENAVFECNICFDIAQDPVITMCGHLHCWPCIYRWLNLHSHHQCPVCKTLIQEDKLVPVYGRGGNASRLIHGEIPRRPAGLRPETAEPTSRRALSDFGGVVLSPVSVRFHEFYGGSLGFNYGSMGESEHWNDKKMMKILVFVLMFVLFDFMAM
ncbi:hypothetical protein ACS0TY_006126 [Phlomoides rotata]